MHRNTKLYRNRSAASSCVGCGGVLDSSYNNCDSCRRRNREKMARLRSKDLKYRLFQYKQGAKSRGLAWKISDDYAIELFQLNCVFCGGCGHGIDRVKNDEGYVEENVQPCCSVCNMMKSTMGHEQFVSHCAKIAEYSTSVV